MKLIYEFTAWTACIAMFFTSLMGFIGSDYGIQSFGFGVITIVFFAASMYPLLTD
jgi:hypothetical protein